MPIITIDGNTIKKGWAKDFTQSNSIGVEAPPGYYSKSTAMSPFRVGRQGQIAPGETFTALADASTRVTGLPLNGAVDSAGEVFCILDNARVLQFGLIDDVVDAHNATAHGAHSSLTGEDVLAYKNATDEYILYSFNDATDGDVGRRTKTGGGYDDDWLSTLGTQTNGSALTKGVPHKMAIGPDGYIYITNGQYIAQHAPNTTAVDYQKLNLGFGFIATAMVTRGSYLIIVGYQATSYVTSYAKAESRAWFWNTTSTSYDFSYDIEDNYVSAVIANGSELSVFTSGKNSTTKRKVFKESYFETVFESYQIGQPPRQGSLDVFQGMIHYSPQSGQQLFCYDKKAFHYRTAVTVDGTSAPTDIGMVKNLSSNLLYIGRKSGASTWDIVKLNYAGYHLDADLRTPIIALPNRSRITKMVAYFSQFGTGASIRLSLFKNYASVSLGGADDLLNKTLTNATYGAVSSISFPVTNGYDIDSFHMNIRFGHASHTNTAAILRKLEIHYEPTDKS